MTADSSYVTYDRVVIDGKGPVNRTKIWLSWNGQYNTIQNSYIHGLSNAVSVPSPVTLSASWPSLSLTSSVFTVSAGSVKLVKGTTCSTAGLTYTYASGSNSGDAKFEIGLDCTATLILPNGDAATCTGTTSDGTSTIPCAVTNQASPVYTPDPTYAGAFKNYPIASFVQTGSSWGSLAGAAAGSVYELEGTQSAYMALGPGPYFFLNNFFSCLGNCLHFDDQIEVSGARPAANVPLTPSGYLIRRNVFDLPLSGIPGHPTWDGYEYTTRETLEFKTGANVLVTGNQFQGAMAGLTQYGFALFSANSSLTISDVEVSFNSFLNGNCAVALISVPHAITGGSCCKGSSPTRFWIHDNLTQNLDAWSFTDQYRAVLGSSSGQVFSMGFGLEDTIVEHNTIADARGSAPDIFHSIGWPQEGQRYANNILWGNSDNGHVGWSQEGMAANTPNCFVPFFSGYVVDAFTCLFLPSWEYKQNLLVTQYADSQHLTGDADSAFRTAYLTGGHALPGALVAAGANPAARASALFVRYTNSSTNNDLRLRSTSPYCSGCASPGTDGKDLGVDVTALRKAQGIMDNFRPISITSSGFTAAFHMSDPGAACTVIYDTAGTALASMAHQSSADTTNSTERAIAITGLSSGTAYDWYVACVGATIQPGPGVRTR
jgi:hypothetical protein